MITIIIPMSLSLSIYIYIYIRTHIHINIYTHTYFSMLAHARFMCTRRLGCKPERGGKLRSLGSRNLCKT